MSECGRRHSEEPGRFECDRRKGHKGMHAYSSIGPSVATDDTERQLRELREAVENAPHHAACHLYDGHVLNRQACVGPCCGCTCWKSRALSARPVGE